MEKSHFIVSPMGQDVSLQQGETYTGSVKLVNPADTRDNLNYTVSVVPYNVSDTNYTANLIDQHNRSEITKWVKVDSPSGSLKPGETTNIDFSINVPENAPGGGQYFALLIGQSPKERKSEDIEIQNIFQIASIVFAKVDGEIIHDGAILQNDIPNFSFTTPVTVGTMLQNNGNVHSVAGIIIEAKDVFTGQVIFSSEEKTPGSLNEVIMPETTRYSSHEISNLPAIGIVHISQTIHFEGQDSVNEQDIIICPIWFLLLLILAIIALIVLTIGSIIHKNKKKTTSAMQ